MIYVDSCYIVKCYFVENGTAEVRELLAEYGDGVSCAHVRIEFLTAIHRQFRESQMTNNGFTEVFCNDRHLLNAAEYFGVRGINVISAA